MSQSRQPAGFGSQSFIIIMVIEFVFDSVSVITILSAHSYLDTKLGVNV